MGTLLCEHLRSEPFLNVDGEFIDCWKPGNKGNTCAGVQRSEIKLFAYELIGNRSYLAGDAGSVLDVRNCFRLISRQKVSGSGCATKVPDLGFERRYPSAWSFENARFTVSLEMPKSTARTRDEGTRPASPVKLPDRNSSLIWRYS
jgi:hypothetical protein